MPAKPRPRKRKPEGPDPSARASIWQRGLSTRVILFCFAAGVLFFFAEPLFSPAASIQWDAVDIHYSAQKYFAEEAGSGRLPFWTPYVFSGMPFLAGPEAGAWYPLNWPFFLLGVTPRAIQWEIALHCLLAAAGAFLLARDLLESRWAAVFCGVFYALSGFFAAHSSHVGMFQTAALFPWLLFTALRASRSVKWLPAVSIAAGLMVLAGHFQTALYAFCGMAFLVAADAAIRRGRAREAILAVVAAAVGAFALSAVMTLPGLELTAESDRASADFSRKSDATLTPGALATLVSPNHYGAPELDNYTGPQDVTQFFYYQGILLLPLALAGLALWTRRWYALALIVPALWYAFGPAGGLYSIASRLPGLRQVRSPVHDWFIVALGLALLAAAGLAALRARFPAQWAPVVLLAVTGADLWYWNLHHNRLAFARTSFYEMYGFPEERFARVARTALVAGSPNRLWSAVNSPAFGSLNAALDTRMEATFGYNPLELKRYARYVEAAAGNPRLLDSLAVTAKFDTATGFFAPNRTALPRVFAPVVVSTAAGPEDAQSRLASFDPAREALAEGVAAIPENGPADLQIVAYDGAQYRVRCRAPRPTLVRLAVPYFPGWQAEIDGRSEKVVPVDLALMGVVVPAGSHEIVFRYHSNRFAAGAAISALAAIAAAIWLFRAFRPADGAART